jgi:hypothetical protein
VAAREIDAADRALEEHVAREDRRLVGEREGHVAGAVAGGEEHVDLQPGELEALTAHEDVLGLVALERPDPRKGDEAHDVREHGTLDLGDPDLGTGLARHRGDRADVVEVGVGEEDGVEGDPESLDHVQNPVGLVARIDDDRARGAVAAHEVAVLLDRADREGADVHG